MYLKLFFLTTTLLLGGSCVLNAQCPDNNTLNLALAEPSQGNTSTACCVWGGEYVTMPVTNSTNYTFETCNTGVADDTYLTLRNDAGGALLGFDDDGCTPHATLSWTATFSGTVRVLVDIGAACGSNANNHQVDITNNGLMPVVWTGFDASVRDEAVHLQWGTAFEVDASHFLVERSADGGEFHEIGKVQASGYRDTPAEYAFTDQAPLNGTNFYRLTEITTLGEAIPHDKLVEVSVARSAALAFLEAGPVPAARNLHVEAEMTPGVPAHLFLYDMLGRRVAEVPLSAPGGRTTADVDVSGLRQGAYILHLEQGNLAVRRRVLIAGE